MTMRDILTRRSALIVLIFFVLVGSVTFGVANSSGTGSKPAEQSVLGEHVEEHVHEHDHSGHSHDYQIPPEGNPDPHANHHTDGHVL